MTATDITGYLAAALGAVAFLPQAIKTLRHRATRDLSFAGLVLLLTNCTLWLAYGLMRRDMPLILANVVTVSALTATLGAKILFERRAA